MNTLNHISQYSYPIVHSSPVLITLAEAKKQLKMEDLGDFDDTIIQDCIDAAVVECENYINSAIRQKKYKVVFNGFQDLMEPKVQYINSVDKVSYTTSTGTTDIENAEDIAAFVQLLPMDRHAQVLKYTNTDSLPELVEDKVDAVTLEVTVGYTAATLPKPIKQAIKLLLTDNYNYRSTRNRSKSYVDSSRVLLEPYRYYATG